MRLVCPSSAFHSRDTRKVLALIAKRGDKLWRDNGSRLWMGKTRQLAFEFKNLTAVVDHIKVIEARDD